MAFEIRVSRIRFRSLAAALGLISVVPCAAIAAAPQYCVLWAREDVRITLLSSNDVDLITATPELIRRMFDRRYAWCVAQDAKYLGLPGGDRRLTDAWVAFMAERILGKRPLPESAGDASEPVESPRVPEAEATNDDSESPTAKGAEASIAMSMSGFPIGSEEHLDWCRAEYRTWDEETRTVIRQGSEGRRVPCP